MNPPPPFLTPCAHETHCPFPHCNPPCPSTYPSCISIALIPIHCSHTHLHFFLNITKPIPSHYSVHIPPHACRHLSLSTPRSSCPLPIHMREAMHATTLLCPPYPSFLTTFLSLHHVLHAHFLSTCMKPCMEPCMPPPFYAHLTHPFLPHFSLYTTPLPYPLS